MYRLFGSIGIRRAFTSNVRSDSSATPKPFSEIPSPKGAVPFLGHFLRIRNRNRFSKDIKKMFEEVKSPIYKLKLPGGTFLVCINDPLGSKQLYSAEGRYPSRSVEKNIQWFYNQRNEEPNFAFMTGPEWRENRTKFGKQLAPANVYGYVPGFNRATERLLRNIKETQDSEGWIKDMEELLIYWSLEVGAWFALGVDLDARNNHREDAFKLKQAIQGLVNTINAFAYALPFYKYFSTPFLKKANKSVDSLNKLSMEYADRHMEQIMEGVNKGEKQYGQSLLEQWLIEGKQTKESAVKNATAVMAAGLDTTANLISFMFYELSKHREVQDKLYNEVVSVLGTTGEPDMDSLQKLPYLMNIIKETQRMSSVISNHTRALPKDSTILGYSIPAGAQVMYCLFTANRSSDVYKDPEDFNPDRWSKGNIDPYASIPFGVGPRSCWGRRFAEIEMKVLLAKVSQRYIMESDCPKEARLPYKEETLIRPDEPINIKFILRD